MRRTSGVLAVATLTIVACAEKAAPAEGFADHVKVEAQSSSDGATLSVSIAPQDGWHINTAYPGIKVSLAESVPAENRTLKKKDVRFKGALDGGKAEAAQFELPLSAPAPKQVGGKYKAVICSADSCSPPFEATFQVPLEESPLPAAPPKKAP